MVFEKAQEGKVKILFGGNTNTDAAGRPNELVLEIEVEEQNINGLRNLLTNSSGDNSEFLPIFRDYINSIAVFADGEPMIPQNYRKEGENDKSTHALSNLQTLYVIDRLTNGNQPYVLNIIENTKDEYADIVTGAEQSDAPVLTSTVQDALEDLAGKQEVSPQPSPDVQVDEAPQSTEVDEQVIEYEKVDLTPLTKILSTEISKGVSAEVRDKLRELLVISGSLEIGDVQTSSQQFLNRFIESLRSKLSSTEASELKVLLSKLRRLPIKNASKSWRTSTYRDFYYSLIKELLDTYNNVETTAVVDIDEEDLI